MALFFVADLHIGHRFVSELRGFVDPGIHDYVLAQRWDDTVTDKNDHVWVLGDISVGGKAAQRKALEWVSERRGVKHLVLGNHDGPFPGNRDSHKWLPEYTEVFSSVQFAARRKILGQSVVLAHLPFDGDHGVDRYPQWRLRDLGTPILHGHTHSQEKVSYSGNGTLQIHVGVDAWDLRPVSLGEIEKLMEGVARGDV